jgi:hypothetical protein
MDNAVQSLYQAIDYASPIWQQAVYRLNASHGLVACAYGVAAWLCFMNVEMTKETLVPCSIWCSATVLLCLLGANVVLQADVFVTQMCRALARLQGWYGQRRELQYLLIGSMAPVVLGAGFWLFKRLEANAQPGSGAVGAGLLALVLLLAVRAVSAHGTDAVLNARLVDVSLGRLFELSGIAWVMVGASRNLRQPCGTPKSCLRSTDRHV